MLPLLKKFSTCSVFTEFFRVFYIETFFKEILIMQNKPNSGIWLLQRRQCFYNSAEKKSLSIELKNKCSGFFWKLLAKLIYFFLFSDKSPKCRLWACYAYILKYIWHFNFKLAFKWVLFSNSSSKISFGFSKII